MTFRVFCTLSYKRKKQTKTNHSLKCFWPSICHFERKSKVLYIDFSICVFSLPLSALLSRVLSSYCLSSMRLPSVSLCRGHRDIVSFIRVWACFYDAVNYAGNCRIDSATVKEYMKKALKLLLCFSFSFYKFHIVKLGRSVEN